MDTTTAITWLFPLMLVLIFYFMLIRPQKKREKQITNMRKSIKAGDKVVTIGGIQGRVVKSKEETLILEIAEKTRIEITRWGVSSVIEAASDKNAKRRRPRPDANEENSSKREVEKVQEESTELVNQEIATESASEDAPNAIETELTEDQKEN